MSKNITTMIGFGFWDGSNNGFAGVNDNVLNLLDFPMESLEGDDLAEDLDSKFRRLGPIPWEALQRLSSTPTLNLQHGSSDMLSNSSVLGKQTCQLNQEPELVEETPIINKPRNSSIRKEPPVPLEPPRSPISALSSSSSCSGEKTVHISLKSPVNSKTRKGRRKKRKISQLFCVKQNSFKKCTHCENTRTPQWRGGPMGPKTLCNACGVRYRIGRLLPEYRPVRSPTFVPSLHSNLHRKVVGMRNGTKEGAAAESEGSILPKPEML